MTAVAASRLHRLATEQRGTVARSAQERCDLCAAAIPSEHRHILDLDSGMPQCVCRACLLLFDRAAAGGDRYRLIGGRRARLHEDAVDGRLWAAIGVPVDLAFVVWSTPASGALAFYPSPLGVTRHPLSSNAWERLQAADPLLEELAPDVEALLIRRTRGARDAWIVPIDDCYRLTGQIRQHWQGFGGGDDVWRQIEQFFAQLTEQEEP